ncbi:hypothetical protein GC174_15170 [bacterium]|nr:hypothetical protein [bacterium]
MSLPIIDSVIVVASGVSAAAACRVGFSPLVKLLQKDSEKQELVTVRSWGTWAALTLGLFVGGTHPNPVVGLVSSIFAGLSVTLVLGVISASQRLPEVLDAAVNAVDGKSEELAQKVKETDYKAIADQGIKQLKQRLPENISIPSIKALAASTPEATESAQLLLNQITEAGEGDVPVKSKDEGGSRHRNKKQPVLRAKNQQVGETTES